MPQSTVTKSAPGCQASEMTLPWEMKKGMEVEGGDGRRVILTLISFIKSNERAEERMNVKK